jgi:hypothetical protein
MEMRTNRSAVPDAFGAFIGTAVPAKKRDQWRWLLPPPAL